jgi:hypothetical protein
MNTLLVMAVIELVNHRREFLPQILMVAAGGYAIFLLPYGLWAFGRIPEYGFAVVLAMILSITVVLSGHTYFSAIFPSPDGQLKKKKRDEIDDSSPFLDEEIDE